MPDIAFLTGDTAIARNDNHERLPRAFREAGWQVTILPHEAMRLEPGGVRLGAQDPARFALIWLVGMGRADTFLDRMQLLRLLPPDRLVIGVHALTYGHAKYAWWRHMPETYASSDSEYLKSKLAQGGEWVAKPVAGSYGRDVVRVCNDSEGGAVLDRLTGGGETYCLLQRYVAQIESGEKRTLVAGGRIIGSYLRLPGNGLRANLAAGGKPHPTSLTAGERDLVEHLAGEFAAGGVGFAAVDTVFPYLMEVNLANPGGLATLESLYREDFTPAVVRAVCRWRGLPGSV